MARLFVAVTPPEEVLERLAALDRPRVVGLRWTDPAQWHVTLRFLGRVDDVAAAAEAVAGFRAGPTVASLGPAVGRFGQRVLHVPVAGLDAVAAAVVAVTGHVGEPPEERPFAGHLTLARASGRVKVDLRALAGQPVEGSWPVEEICLVESHLSPKGARYETLERFPLRC
ncbi:MAG TPA: RNA 2',3'-cyclic phosphodiesterase [Acidimicrobiales bacterium]|jgi:2'-5' RNA ligase|nr:RNA 2',3'-cyclic phosphodiesterase [Acidimicrobiales bacterium]